MNCESSGGVKSTIGGGNGTYNSVGGIAGYNLGGKINNCTSRGSVEAYNEGNFSMTHAGGIVARNEADNSTVSNCVSYSNVKANGYMGSTTGGIAGINFGTLENCLVIADSVSGNGSVNGTKDAAIGHNNYSGSDSGTITNCAWVKKPGMSDDIKGVGSYSGDPGVTELDDSTDLLANAVTSLTASIDPSTITKEGTAAITLTTGPVTPENAFDETSGAVRDIQLSDSYNEDVVTVAQGENAASYTVTPVDFGATDITITANLYTVDFTTLNSTPAYTVGPTPYTFTLPVTVAAEAAPSQPGASGGSGSTGGGGGGGGCSAGFGALALLAAVPLLFRRKK